MLNGPTAASRFGSRFPFSALGSALACLALVATLAGCATTGGAPTIYRDGSRNLVAPIVEGTVPSEVVTASGSAVTQWWLRDEIDDPTGDIGSLTRLDDKRTSPLLALVAGGVGLAEEDVVRLTLAHNLTVQVSDAERQAAIANVSARTGSVYDLLLTITANQTWSENMSYTSSSSTSNLASSGSGIGSAPVETSGSLDDPLSVSERQVRTGRTELGQKLPTGGTAGVFYQEVRTDLDSNASSLTNPYTQSIAGLTLTQPLLRGFGPTVTNAPINIARIDRNISEHAFRGELSGQLSQALRSYYNLIFAYENAAVQRITLLQALDLEAINKIRQNVGDLAQVDVELATAQVARQEEQYLIAIQRCLDRQDELRRVMNLPGTGALGWELMLLPTTMPTYADMVDARDSELFQVALLNRPDYAQAALRVDRAGINLAVANNDLLPRLNVTGEYGVLGDNADSGRAREMASENDYQEHRLGVELTFPLQNREARYNRLARTLDRDAAETRLRDLALSIRQEIRLNLRALETARKRIDVTLAGIRAEQAKFDSERRRYEVGLSTSFQLLDALDDLSNAKVSHLQALVDYRLALIDLKQSQGILLGDLGVSIAAPTERPTPNFVAADAAGPGTEINPGNSSEGLDLTNRPPMSGPLPGVTEPEPAVLETE